jgi:hypothetical protein
MRFMIPIALVVACASLAACDDMARTGVSPTPSISATPTAPPSPPSGPSGSTLASVALSNLSVTRFPQPNGDVYYGTKFRLTETSGKSDAVVTEVNVTTDRGLTESTDSKCWSTPIVVTAGHSSDAFDSGWSSLLYCAPGVTTQTPPLSVSVIVRFVDDLNVVSSVTGTVGIE